VRISRVLLGLVAFSLAAFDSFAEGQPPGEQTESHSLANTEVPGDSLFRLDVQLETADDRTVAFSSLRGRPLLISLFYSQCSSVCPMTVAELQTLERSVPPQARENLTVLLISLDAARDTPAALTEFMQQHHIGGPHWMVARASASDVRLLAAALGVRYRELPDHTFNHSTVITLTDSEGIIQARADGWQAVDAGFIEKVRSIGAAKAATRPDHG